MTLAIMGSLSGIVAIAQPSPTASAATCGDALLTFPAWYKGLTQPGTDCELKEVKGTVSDPDKQIDMRDFIVRVIMNVIEIILQLVGYAAVVMLIIGGYQYIVSAGDANLMTSAKKTITNSLVGLVISIFSVASITLISSIFDATSTTSTTAVGGTSVDIQQVNADQATLVTILNAVYAWAAIVAVLVIVIAGFFFVTSRGDANMVQRARKGILGAVVGLVIVLMAFVITQFVLGSVG